MAALLAGEVDGLIVDEYAGQGYSGVGWDAVKLLPETLSTGELGFIFPPGSDLIEPINRALAVIRDDGRLDCDQRALVPSARSRRLIHARAARGASCSARKHIHGRRDAT